MKHLLVALLARDAAEVHRVPLTKVPRVRQSSTAFSKPQRVAAAIRANRANGRRILFSVHCLRE